jgi:hypothetical protein
MDYDDLENGVIDDEKELEEMNNIGTEDFNQDDTEDTL